MKTLLVRSTSAASARPVVIFLAALAMFAVYYRLAWPFLMLSLILSYLAAGYCWAWLSCRKMTVGEGIVRDKVFTGETLQWKFCFTNIKAFPLVRCGFRFYLPQGLIPGNGTPAAYVQVAEPWLPEAAKYGIMPNYWNCGTLQYSWLPVDEGITVQLQVLAGLRGSYYLPPVRFFAGDPSGLYQGFGQIGREQYINVYPRPLGNDEVKRILSFAENRREDIYGLEDRYDSYGVREYQPNDSPKSINWYATAKTGEIKSNLYQRKDSVNCMIVLDMTSGFQPVVEPDQERVEDPLLEKTISFACGLALSQLKMGYQTAFMTNSPRVYWGKKQSDQPGSMGVDKKRDRRITILDFGGGLGQGEKILRLCAELDDTGRGSLTSQERMWRKIHEIAPHAVVYLLCYHNPPPSWQGFVPIQQEPFPDPFRFYTPQRLAELPALRVHLLNLSEEGGSR